MRSVIVKHFFCFTFVLNLEGQTERLVLEAVEGVHQVTQEILEVQTLEAVVTTVAISEGVTGNFTFT